MHISKQTKMSHLNLQTKRMRGKLPLSLLTINECISTIEVENNMYNRDNLIYCIFHEWGRVQQKALGEI